MAQARNMLLCAVFWRVPRKRPTLARSKAAAYIPDRLINCGVKPAAAQRGAVKVGRIAGKPLPVPQSLASCRRRSVRPAGARGWFRLRPTILSANMRERCDDDQS